MKVFLTGATGFIGQSLTRQLREEGWEVVALVRRPESPAGQAVAALGATVVKGDILDVESMRPALAGADIVIHNAGMYEYGITGKKKDRMYAINVTGTDNVLGLALELNIPRTVYVSSIVAFGETGAGEPVDETFEPLEPFTTFYAGTKAKAHDIAHEYMKKGLPLLIGVPNGVVGPNDHSAYGYFLRLYLNKMLTPFGWGANDVLALVHVDDLAAGLVLIAKKGEVGETYFLSGEPHTRKRMLDWWAQKPGGLKFRLYLPRMLAATLFGPMAPLLRLAGLPAFISWETLLSVKNLNTSSQKAQTELGWTYRGAEQMWLEIVDAEIELQEKRSKRDLISRLKPVEA